MGANDPQDMANLDPRDMVGKIYVGDNKHCYMCLIYKLWASWFKVIFLLFIVNIR